MSHKSCQRQNGPVDVSCSLCKAKRSAELGAMDSGSPSPVERHGSGPLGQSSQVGRVSGWLACAALFCLAVGMSAALWPVA